MSMKGVEVALNLESALDMLRQRHAEEAASHALVPMLNPNASKDAFDPIAAMIEEIL